MAGDRHSIPTSPAAGSAGGARALIALLLLVLVVAVYLPAAHFEFLTIDDPDYVTANAVVRGGLSPAGLRWAFTTFHAANWHPLTWVSHMLDASFFGLRPGAHHVVSVGFHLANAILLFVLLARLTGSTWRSGFVAAVFALHPVQTESVAWVAERKSLLSGTFWMLTLLAYCRYAARPCASAYLAVLGAFAAGLLAKPVLVTLPLVLFLLDFWPLGRCGAGRAGGVRPSLLLAEKFPLLLLSLLSGLITLAAQSRSGAVADLDRFPLPARLGNACLSVVRYLADLFLPRRLAIFHPHPGTDLPVAAALAAGAALVALTALAWRARRTHPAAATGWAWYLGVLAPMIGILQVGTQGRADRYLYLPLIGVLMALGWGLGASPPLRASRRGALAATGLLVLCLLAAAASRQAQRWHSSLPLLEHTVAVEPRGWFSRTALGNVLATAGRLGEAREQFETSLLLRPDSSLTHHRLALVLDRLGRREEAREQYLETIRLQPDAAEAQANLAALLLDMGHDEEALRHARRAAETNRASPTAHGVLANALVRAGNPGQANAHYREAVRLAPEDAGHRGNLGRFLAAQRFWAEAEEQLREAVRLDPGRAEAHNDLGAVLMILGRPDDARHHLERALRLAPGSAAARENLRRLAAGPPSASSAR